MTKLFIISRLISPFYKIYELILKKFLIKFHNYMENFNEFELIIFVCIQIFFLFFHIISKNKDRTKNKYKS
jgi:hypothetical protein